MLRHYKKHKKWCALCTFLAFIAYIFFPTFHELRTFYSTAADVDGLSYDDEKLIAFTKKFLVPPSTLPYNLTVNLTDYSEFNTSSTVLNLLKNKTNGFFVECGALTGELISTTLMMEKHYGWTGLLVEGAPSNVKILLQKQRKAWIAPGCMSVSNVASITPFSDHWVFGGVKEGLRHVNITDVLCIPFNTMMAALGRNQIDYFSLDVEGQELVILKTIDFERIQIDVMTVEHVHNKYILDEVIQHMEANNFTLHMKGEYDFFFTNKRLAL